jgi:PAS domain S-box-containing protein
MQNRANSRSLRWVSVVTLLSIFAVGVALAIARARRTDALMRADLVRLASLTASALDAAAIVSLPGEAGDVHAPRYLRLKQQLMEARALYPDVRFIYLARVRSDGRVIFLADSEDPASKDYSPPGQVYDEASDALRSLFSRPRVITEGPIRDRWGVWVTAFVPIEDSVTGSVAAVLGMDTDAGIWARRVALSGAALLGFAVPLMGLWLVLYRRLRRRGGAVRRKHAFFTEEAQFALCAGLVLTLYALFDVWDRAGRRRLDEFMRQAELQAGMMQDFLGRIGTSYLRSIAQFVSGSQILTREEFAGFIDYLRDRPYALFWGYLPLVRSNEVAAYVEDAKIAGVRPAEIWEWGPSGEIRAAMARGEHFPLRFAEPPLAELREIGLDHASDPRRFEALRRAAESDLAEATDPIALSGGDRSESAIFVYYPAKSVQSGALQGFAVVALRPSGLLVRTLKWEVRISDAQTHVALCIPDSEGGLTVVAGTSGGPPISERLPMRAGKRAQLFAPAFAFGRVFVIAMLPADPSQMLPISTARNTAGVGFLLTGMLASLVSTLTRRRAELERLVDERTAELRASESSYHGLFNSIRQAIYIQDRNGCFLDVNDAAVSMYGYAREEFIGRPPDFLSAPGHNNMAEIYSHIRRAWEGDPQEFEFWGLRKSGEIFPKTVSLYKCQYFGKDALIAVAADISERKQAAEQQARLQVQLQQAQKLESIGRLAGGVAHDFNNMLQAILGNAMLALDETTDLRVREYLAEIKRSTERSAALTRQLLAFASRQAVNPKVIDLNETVAGTLKMLRRLIGENIQLRWNPARDLWPVRIDPVQVDQILANLTVNARDAIDGVGFITIETWNLPAGDDSRRKNYPNCPPGDFSCLRVADTGRGMDAHTLEHIFEPFYTTKTDGKGVGLGLATVFGIVKQNNGFIHVESEPGKGASFVIGLPRTRQTAASETDDGRTPRAVGGRETIFIVEDEESVLRLCETALRNLGYTVLAESQPERAIERVRTHEGAIHLLVTDVVMPGMNGRELARRLSEIRPGLRVLYISGYTADIIETREVLNEGVLFLHKPFRSDLLSAKVLEALDAPAAQKP